MSMPWGARDFQTKLGRQSGTNHRGKHGQAASGSERMLGCFLPTLTFSSLPKGMKNVSTFGFSYIFSKPLEICPRMRHIPPLGKALPFLPLGSFLSGWHYNVALLSA